MIQTAQPRRHTSGWKLPAASLCTLLALSTTGCTGSSGDDTPSPNPTHTIAPVETEVFPSPSPTQLPPPPKEMSEETDEGAIATVRYFINAVNLAYQTNDETLFANLQTNDCASCKKLIAQIRDVQDSGGAYEHYELSLGVVRKTGYLENDEQTFGVSVDVTEEPYNVKGSDGELRTAIADEATTRTIFLLTFEQGKWLIKDFVA